jgi:histidinol-phosphate aminotransferase
MAGIRLGMAFAGSEIIDILTRIKYPYNINILTQRAALESLANTNKRDEWIRLIVSQREYLKKELMKIPLVKNILNSDANFLMVKFDQPQEIFSYLNAKKIIVRDRSRVSLCEGYLRFTIGSESENRLLIEALKELK